MKIRTDFVTNSSSSSFIIATKDKLTKKLLLDSFNIGEKSPLYPLAKNIAEKLINLAKEKDINKEIEELIEYECRVPDIYYKIRDQNMHFYEGYVSNECDGAETILYALDMHYEDENIVLKKEGGY